MLSFTPLKTRKPRQFDYRPRYFDPEKEAWEEHKKKVRGERSLHEDTVAEEYEPGEYVRQLRIRRGIIADRGRKIANKKAVTVRIAILIAVALLMAWYIFS